MNKNILMLSVLILFSLSINHDSATISPNNLVVQIEYTKPISSVQSLNVIFQSRPSAQLAEQMVRDAINMMIKNIPPSVEILGVAWFSKNGTEESEEMIAFANAKTSIVYNPKTKQFSYL